MRKSKNRYFKFSKILLILALVENTAKSRACYLEQALHRNTEQNGMFELSCSVMN